MEIEQPPTVLHPPPKSLKTKKCVLDELDDNLEGGICLPSNGVTAAQVNGSSNGHGHIGRSLSVAESIAEEEEEDELELDELENQNEVENRGAGQQRKGHRSGSLASTGTAGGCSVLEIYRLP